MLVIIKFRRVFFQLVNYPSVTPDCILHCPNHITNLVSVLFVCTGLPLEIPPCGDLHPSTLVTPPVTFLTPVWTTGWTPRSMSSSTMTRATRTLSFTTKRYRALSLSKALDQTWICPYLLILTHSFFQSVEVRDGCGFPFKMKRNRNLYCCNSIGITL